MQGQAFIILSLKNLENTTEVLEGNKFSLRCCLYLIPSDPSLLLNYIGNCLAYNRLPYLILKYNISIELHKMK